MGLHVLQNRVVIIMCNVMYVGVPDQMVDAVTLLRDRAEREEANILYSLVNDLSKVNKHGINISL